MSAYKTIQMVFTNKGLVARYAQDRPPDPSQYLNLDNLECRQENAISSRFGLQSITHDTASQPLPAPVHSLGRLKSLSAAAYPVSRLAGAGTKVYMRGANTPGAYVDVTGSFTLSGNAWSEVSYAPEQSSFPYAYIFDLAHNVKILNPLSTLAQTGINPPLVPVSNTLAVGTEQFVVIDTFDSSSSITGAYTYSNLTARSTPNRTNVTFSSSVAAGYEFTPTSGGGISSGQLLVAGYSTLNSEVVLVGQGTGSVNGFSAYFGNTHASSDSVEDWFLQGSIASTTTAYVAFAFSAGLFFDLSAFNGITMAGTDVFTLGFKVDTAANIASVTLLFPVGAAAQTPGSYTDYYSLSLNIAGLAAGWNYLTGLRSAFTANGKAGQPGYDWGFVQGYQVTVVTNGGGGVTVGFDDFYVSVGSKLDVTGGIPYNYRFTYYDANTGTESNGSVPQVDGNQVSPVGQSVALIFNTTGVVAEVTNIRIYRMGGSLSGAWYQIDQIPIAQTTYLDSWPDSQIVNNPQLQLDNDPPVTSTLPNPLVATLVGNTPPNASTTVTIVYTGISQTIVAGQLLTIGTGSKQEQVYVQTGGTTTFKAYFQLWHNPSNGVVTITGSTSPAMGVNLSCVAFDMVWLAGDINNPSTLYFSKRFNPEAYPPQNTLIVGPPSDPIMGIVFYRGQLYVWTLTTIYQIIAAGQPVPFAIITGSIHGLFANFGIAPAENELPYMGIDGIYAFSGSSQLLSEIIDWIITGKTLGPVIPMDTTKTSSVKAAFCDNEVYFSYTGTDGNLHRIIWHLVYKRWRNDDVPALSMLYEQDTGYLIVGEANGNIYQDRVGDFDDGGWSGGVETQTPIQINLQTNLLDFGNQKADKYIQELSLDLNTSGQNLTVTFYYDNLGSSFTDTFTVNTPSRKQVHFNVNNGLGYRARRLGMKITGGVTSVVDLFQWDVRVMLDAEARQSFDTGNADFGTSEFKIVKQAYFEYQAQNGPVTVSCYLEGSDQVAYSFTLPQTPAISDASTNTLGKNSVKVRFPATKARIYRFIGTCSGDFKLYDGSFMEWKPITSEKGYQKHQLTETASVT